MSPRPTGPQPHRWSPQLRGLMRLFAREERLTPERAILLAISSVPPEKARRAREYGRYNTRGGKDARRGRPKPEPTMKDATEYGARRILHQTIAGAVKAGYLDRERDDDGQTVALCRTEQGRLAAEALVEWENRRGRQTVRPR